MYYDKFCIYWLLLCMDVLEHLINTIKKKKVQYWRLSYLCASCRVGGFSEEGKGTPEDLIFFYSHLDKGGELCRVPECLLIYRYHQNATTFSIHECVLQIASQVPCRLQTLVPQVMACIWLEPWTQKKPLGCVTCLKTRLISMLHGFVKSTKK
jgi:hypothetical protein